MDVERGGAKRQYEPPRVVRLDAEREAAGACAPSGSSDYDCQTGAVANGICVSGGAAGNRCTMGPTAY
jgi:hypothetical protein